MQNFMKSKSSCSFSVAVSSDCTRPTASRRFIRKFAVRKVFDFAERVTFEVSDGMVSIELYRAGLPEMHCGVITLALEPRPPSCEPDSRWLVQKARSVSC